MDADKIKLWLRRLPLINKSLAVAQGGSSVINLVLGASAVTFLLGVIKGEPHWAMAAAAFVACYGFSAYEKIEAWLDGQTLENKLTIANICPVITPCADGAFTVYVTFYLVNNADYDLCVAIDDESFYISDKHMAKPILTTAISSIAKHSSYQQMSAPMLGVKPGTDDQVNVKLSIRYGKKQKDLSMRLISHSECYLPAAITQNQAQTLGYLNLKSHYESIRES